MLALIPDARQRKLISDIATGEIVKEIKCESDTCDGRVIGHVYKDGSIHPTTDAEGLMHMRAYRNRLDGFLGFECWCGNDSRLAPQEKDVAGMSTASPSKADLEKVWGNVAAKPSNYPVVDGRQEVDGFVIEEVA